MAIYPLKQESIKGKILHPLYKPYSFANPCQINFRSLTASGAPERESLSLVEKPSEVKRSFIFLRKSAPRALILGW